MKNFICYVCLFIQGQIQNRAIIKNGFSFFLQENLLLDEDQNLKLIDFGLCAKPKVRNVFQNILFNNVDDITKFLNKKSKDYIIYTTVLLIVYNWDL